MSALTKKKKLFPENQCAFNNKGKFFIVIWTWEGSCRSLFMLAAWNDLTHLRRNTDSYEKPKTIKKSKFLMTGPTAKVETISNSQICVI